ncbi:hypothetical protein D3C73_1016760 [compost metagenome]
MIVADALRLLPSNAVTVILAEPSAIPLMIPVLLTLTTLGLSDDQVKGTSVNSSGV